MMLLTEETVNILFAVYQIEKSSSKEFTYGVVADALKDMIEGKYQNQLKNYFHILLNRKCTIDIWQILDICAKFSASKLLRKRASKFIRMIKKGKITIPGKYDMHDVCLEYLKTDLITVEMPVFDFASYQDKYERKQLDLNKIWKRHNRYREFKRYQYNNKASKH